MLPISKDSLELISTGVQGLSSVVLAGLTFFYLREVAATRKMTARALELDWTTDLQAELATSHYIPDTATGSIHVPYTLTISSIGKLPVELLGGQLSIKIGEGTTTHEIRPVNKLGSSTRQSFTMSFPRSGAEIERIAQLDKDTAVTWDSPLPLTEAEITLKYKDGLKKQDCEKSFTYKYEFNEWKQSI